MRYKVWRTTFIRNVLESLALGTFDDGSFELLLRMIRDERRNRSQILRFRRVAGSELSNALRISIARAPDWLKVRGEFLKNK